MCNTISYGVNSAQGHRKLELKGPGNLWSHPDVSNKGTVFPMGCDLAIVTHRETNLSLFACDFLGFSTESAPPWETP